MHQLLLVVILCGFVADEAHALLCARRNDVVVSRAACKHHEQVISVQELLPPPVVHSAFSTSRVGPVAVPNPEGDLSTFITPIAAVTTIPAGSYVVTATAFISNQRALVDTVSCTLTHLPAGLAPGAPFATSALLLDGATASGAMISVVGALTLSDSQNEIHLWCTGKTSLSMFTAEAVSLVAVPVDNVQTQ